ncbi:hypothetical protein K435DRAFT_863165 [Dendrothele bispora CBS 962.96]|uniref:Uncharacterized protein n=1 Tax=Dendrothele bispora (strain CBS 962.96) TaxID=1314807 RepID=A0A4S8LQK8_DENBC|nr:hypothetical protein K435DRAFT_863165 [Dendrothele bispora CBS 962.96]
MACSSAARPIPLFKTGRALCVRRFFTALPSRRGAANSVGVGRRPRGGMAYQNGRPLSLVDTPEDLAFALGGSPMRNSDADVSRGIMEELTVGGEIEEVVSEVASTDRLVRMDKGTMTR